MSPEDLITNLIRLTKVCNTMAERINQLDERLRILERERSDRLAATGRSGS